MVKGDFCCMFYKPAAYAVKETFEGAGKIGNRSGTPTHENKNKNRK
jgi:hypothetical protein